MHTKSDVAGCLSTWKWFAPGAIQFDGALLMWERGGLPTDEFAAGESGGILA